MTVRKKVLTREKIAPMMRFPELRRVLQEISKFNPSGDDVMPEVGTESEAPRKPGRPKKVVKKTVKKVKKVAAKSDNMVTLSELCGDKIEPMTARRYLRNSNIKQGPTGRWSWEKGSKAIGEVKKLLAEIGK